MTHTLHPEIIDDIVNSMNHYVDEHMYHALGMKKVLEKHLGPYLKDRTTRTMTEHMMEAEEKIRQMHEAIKRKDGEITILGNTYRLVDKELPPSQHLKDEPSNDDIVQIGISGGYQIYAKRGFARKAAQSIRGYGNDKYIPEPLENEPAPKRFIVRIKETNKFMASCMTEAAARHYVKTSPISEHLEITEEPKDNEPLPEKEIDDKTKLGIYDTTQNIMQDIRTYVYEYDEVQKMRLLALLDKHLLKFGGQEQSTPKIEKINIAYMEGCGEQTVWEEPIIVKKINEVIDYINNKD